jgi:hypothetical protein
MGNYLNQNQFEESNNSSEFQEDELLEIIDRENIEIKSVTANNNNNNNNQNDENEQNDAQNENEQNYQNVYHINMKVDSYNLNKTRFLILKNAPNNNYFDLFTLFQIENIQDIMLSSFSSIMSLIIKLNILNGYLHVTNLEILPQVSGDEKIDKDKLMKYVNNMSYLKPKQIYLTLNALISNFYYFLENNAVILDNFIIIQKECIDFNNYIMYNSNSLILHYSNDKSLLTFTDKKPCINNYSKFILKTIDKNKFNDIVSKIPETTNIITNKNYYNNNVFDNKKQDNNKQTNYYQNKKYYYNKRVNKNHFFKNNYNKNYNGNSYNKNFYKNKYYNKKRNHNKNNYCNKKNEVLINKESNENKKDEDIINNTSNELESINDIEELNVIIDNI